MSNLPQPDFFFVKFLPKTEKMSESALQFAKGIPNVEYEFAASLNVLPPHVAQKYESYVEFDHFSLHPDDPLLR